MGELITIIIEAACLVLSLLVEAIVWLVRGSVTLFGFAFSKKYRSAKQAEWAGSPLRKFVTLGYSSACLAALIGFVIWANIDRPEDGDATNVEAISIGDTNPEGVRRVELTVTNKQGAVDVVAFDVRTGSFARILGTKTLDDLGAELSNSIVVLDDTIAGNTNN